MSEHDKIEKVRRDLDRAVRGFAALVWYKEFAEKHLTTVVEASAGVTNGSATTGAKEMNFYLQLAAQQMAPAILMEAYQIAKQDLDRGSVIVEILEKST